MMQRVFHHPQRRLAFVWTLLVLPVLLVSCVPSGVLQDVQQHQQQWQSSGIRSYRYQLQMSCFCAPPLVQPVMIEVRSGTAIAITDAKTGAPVDQELFARFNTIDKLFFAIRDVAQHSTDDIDVTYDPALDYPTEIRIDELRHTIDDEMAYTISRFEAIK
jgi:hypothetical protein